MYDALTLDQLRALVTVADEGSFSAAARKLHRVQSAISTAMANLEALLGVPIWDRSKKVPRLTDAGQAVLASARRVLAEVDGLRRVTANLATGLETRVALCLDAFFPLPALIDLCVAFAREFPEVDLRVEHQVLSAVSARVLSGAASLGVVSAPGLASGLEAHALSAIRMVPVVGPRHRLAALSGKIPAGQLAGETQIVLSEHAEAGVADQGVLSARTWRVGDLTPSASSSAPASAGATSRSTSPATTCARSNWCASSPSPGARTNTWSACPRSIARTRRWGRRIAGRCSSSGSCVSGTWGRGE